MGSIFFNCRHIFIKENSFNLPCLIKLHSADGSQGTEYLIQSCQQLEFITLKKYIYTINKLCATFILMLKLFAKKKNNNYYYYHHYIIIIILLWTLG